MRLQVSIAGDHNVIGAHAHANLLGWVTMAMLGTLFALWPAKAEGRAAMVQYGVYTAGVMLLALIVFSNRQSVAGREAAAGS